MAPILILVLVLQRHKLLYLFKCQRGCQAQEEKRNKQFLSQPCTIKQFLGAISSPYNVFNPLSNAKPWITRGHKTLPRLTQFSWFLESERGPYSAVLSFSLARHTHEYYCKTRAFGRCAAKKAGQFPGQKYSFILFFSFVVILFLQDKRPWFKRLSFVELSLSTRVSAASAAGLCCG